MTASAVVGELVAEMRARATLLHEKFGLSGVECLFSQELEDFADRLSALTAEAGKVNELSGNSGQLPEAGKGEVTDAMVDAFAHVYWGNDWPFRPETDANRELMFEFRHIIRRGLIAALSTATPAGEWEAKAFRMITELRDYVVNERDAQVLPRKRDSYQRELNEIDDFLAASPRGASESSK